VAAAEGKVADAEYARGEAIAGFVERWTTEGHLDDDLGELVELVLERSPGYRNELESSRIPGAGPAGQPNELVSVAHEFSADRENAAALESRRRARGRRRAGHRCAGGFLERVSLARRAERHPEHAPAWSADAAEKQRRVWSFRWVRQGGRTGFPQHAVAGRSTSCPKSGG